MRPSCTAVGFEIGSQASQQEILKTECPARIFFQQIAYLEGMNIEIPCTCKTKEITSVAWYYKKHINTNEIKVLMDFKGTLVAQGGKTFHTSSLLSRFRIQEYSLVIARTQPEDSGHYMCGTKAGQFFFGFEVDIQESTDALVTFEELNQHPSPDLITNQFKAFTTFWEWTKCDRCDVRGEQRRLGLCYIQSPFLYPLYRLSLLAAASCGSDAVPPRLKKQLSNRKTEILVRSCETPCQKKKKGLFGAFVNTVMNVANYINNQTRFLQRFKVPTQVHHHPVGGNLVITCPKARPEQAVAWDKDKERLYLTKYLIRVKPQRIYIDHGNNLHISLVQQRDQGIYYCWLEGKLKYGFRLTVDKSASRRRFLSDSDSFFALKMIGIAFLGFAAIFVLCHIIKCCFYCCKCCQHKVTLSDIV
ncbi:hypothetical protein GDO86_003130 [Hymenochirus boettgeri]|uniref:Ig-like domain-containing protein n=1 Tax=Hymenochirus boettgeri TaxID=247094 RepID=A0A8T2JZP2_9PIPI|nr:hypothetical protein GDO86_003130 [Hymenochirus boettgeri]